MRRTFARRLLLVLLGLLALSGAAFADCTSPAGIAGSMAYSSNFNQPAWCDGTHWNTFGGSSGGGGADNLGNHTAAQDLNMSGFSINSGLNATFTGLGNFGSLLSGGLTVTGAASITTISTSLIQVGQSSLICGASINGAIRYNTTSGTIQVCAPNNVWTSLASGTTAGGGNPAGSTGDIQFNSSGSFDADTGKLYWDKTNHRLGISTSTPLDMLDVRPVAFANNQDGGIRIGTPGGQWVNRIALKSDNSGLPRLAFDVTSDNAGNTSETLSILRSGNVGIGTFSPAAKLDVSGTINATGYINAGSTLYTQSHGFMTYYPAASATVVGNDAGNWGNTLRIGQSGLQVYAGGADRMVVSATGNVGIGTTSPSRELEVSGTGIFGQGGDNIIKLNSSFMEVSKSGLSIGYNQTYNGQSFTNTAYLQAETQNVAYRNIALNPVGGSIGIGTGAPSATLTVSGTMWTTGNVAIGTALSVTGNVTAASFLYSSDKRLKSDIADLTGALAKLDTLNPVSFRFTADPSKTIHLGLIAQDVRKVYPQAVHADDKGFLSLDYPALVGPIIEMLKELKAIVMGDHDKIVRLEAANDNLRQANAELVSATSALKAANDNLVHRMDTLEKASR